MAITNGYATLANLKARLGIAAATTTHDTVLEAIVESVSRQIDDECGRQFFAATQTRYYTAKRCDRLLVDDLLSVTTLKTDADGDRTYEDTWDVSGSDSDIDLMPFNAQSESPARPYWELRTTPNADYSFPVGIEKGVEIAGSWGFASTTPDVIEAACFFQCAVEWQAKDAPLGERGGGEFATELRAIGLHPFVKRMLQPYRLVRAA